MIRIAPDSAVPLYDQIKAGLRGLVARGQLKPGDEAPSIRALAVRLRVNPNTVARAYRELTAEGFFESRRGEGSVISASAVKRLPGNMAELSDGLRESLRHVRRGGLGWPEIEAVLKEARKEEP
ncbi:MAG: GntR family transcriptional regulator [Elusimicrobia bacterium]|nr:GntR family transcriptional regulator [Elusimicrobiota bacterium]